MLSHHCWGGCIWDWIIIAFKYNGGKIIDIKKIIIKRLSNYCYINDIKFTGYENVLNNVIHENDIQYIIAENFFNENKKEIIEEMIKNERERKTDKGN